MVPRYRNSGNLTPQLETKYRQPVGGALVVDGTRSGMLHANDYKSMTGWDIPNYHQRVKSGVLLPQTPFRKFEVAVTGTGQNDQTNTGPNPDIRYWYKDPPYFVWHNTLESEDFLRAFVTGLDIDMHSLVQEAAAAIYSQGHDTLTFIAELKKTIALFTQAGRSLLGLLAKGEIAKTWLQYRYGWRILYFDMQNIRKAVASLEHNRKRYSETRGRSFSGASSTDSTIIGSTVDASFTETISWNLSVRGNVVADIDPPAFSFNPVITAWELISYSFVIDWFLKVGQWLATMSFVAFSSDYVASTGYKLTYDHRIKLVSHSSGKSGWVINNLASDSRSVHTLAERVPTSVPFRLSTNFRIPEALKILDLLALVHRALRR